MGDSFVTGEQHVINEYTTGVNLGWRRHHDVRDLWICPTCAAVVPDNMWRVHHNWHTTPTIEEDPV